MESVVLKTLTTDTVLFFLLQGGVLLFALFAVVKNWFRSREVTGGLSMKLGRGKESMGLFYGTYAAINGLLVAVSLSIPTNHRVFWVIVDTFLSAYVCLFNHWFRNILVGWAERLKIEKTP